MKLPKELIKENEEMAMERLIEFKENGVKSIHLRLDHGKKIGTFYPPSLYILQKLGE